MAPPKFSSIGGPFSPLAPMSPSKSLSPQSAHQKIGVWPINSPGQCCFQSSAESLTDGLRGSQRPTALKAVELPERENTIHSSLYSEVILSRFPRFNEDNISLVIDAITRSAEDLDVA